MFNLYVNIIVPTSSSPSLEHFVKTLWFSHCEILSPDGNILFVLCIILNHSDVFHIFFTPTLKRKCVWIRRNLLRSFCCFICLSEMLSVMKSGHFHLTNCRLQTFITQMDCRDNRNLPFTSLPGYQLTDLLPSDHLKYTWTQISRTQTLDRTIPTTWSWHTVATLCWWASILLTIWTDDVMCDELPCFNTSNLPPIAAILLGNQVEWMNKNE